MAFMYDFYRLIIVITSICGVPSSSCDAPCPRYYSPVCATDGRTYVNPCKFRVAQCLAQGRLGMLYGGACQASHQVRITAAPVDPGLEADPLLCRKTGCTYNLQPVCGTDGMTYTNMCLLNLEQKCSNGAVTLAHEGNCVTDNTEFSNNIKDINEVMVEVTCEKACRRNMDPVCASDWKTYSNKCMFEVENCKHDNVMHLVSEGSCPKQQEEEYVEAHPEEATSDVEGDPEEATSDEASKTPSSTPPLPVRVTGRTMPIRTTAVPRMMPAASPDCPTSCPMVYRPVCSSNGKTYSNMCSFRVTNCRLDYSLTVVKQGRCRKRVKPQVNQAETTGGSNVYQEPLHTTPGTTAVPPSPFCENPCPMNLAPVCGSDGITYVNKCSFDNHNCKQGNMLTISSTGDCNETRDDGDDDDNAAAAAADDDDQGNNDDQDDDDDINEEEKEHYCPTVCTYEYSPVCGSDDITYGNICQLNSQRCKYDGFLEIVYYGACKEIIN